MGDPEQSEQSSSSMFARRTYYSLKPFLPWHLRMALRRWRAARMRKSNADIWPIDSVAGHPPQGWPGWPNGKRFAVVLSHDVESAKGLENCRSLMELEKSLGFRSSFNFVPEGYNTPRELRDLLTAQGFEVGVHDLKHDGKLYVSYKKFQESAKRINRYLKEWGAVGFRSGFMLHKLDWLHELNALYDSSTFDTDPFEPQPDGVNTIFPFWVPKSGGGGYVELPYTLVQDFNLFVVLKERTVDIWKQKLDWIAVRGGMALLDVHPDYIDFNNAGAKRDEYPAALYAEFLQWIKKEYAGQYWQPLPREVAGLVYQHRAVLSNGHPTRKFLQKIWIDLDNTPHVPFFQPIIRELEKRGYRVVLTARDAFQVCELASRYGLPYTRIGHHYGKNLIRKLLGLICRTFQLLPFALRHKPLIGLSHGARSQMLLCNLLRIPTVLIMDYEHSKSPPLARPRWEIVPDALPYELLYPRKERVRKYSGIKEDVYAPEFTPDPAILEQLHLPAGYLIITVRPPATEAHYHNPESEALFIGVMDRIWKEPRTCAVLLPRNKKQGAEIRRRWPHWFEHDKVIIPEMVVDGLNLIWFSDLVVSGGGTMNREAAALGVPVYSIFRGKIGAVDHRLQEEGRLVLVEKVEDVDKKILFRPREKNRLPDRTPRKALQHILDHVEEIIKLEYPSAL